MDDKRRVKVSKYLSKHLRHEPERLGLTLGPGGWVAVDDLLRACADHHFAVSAEELREVVESNEKQRFAFDETGAMIRANQGHSVTVDLELVPTAPPEVLFHGTGAGSAESILRSGLERRSRARCGRAGRCSAWPPAGGRSGRGRGGVSWRSLR